MFFAITIFSSSFAQTSHNKDNEYQYLFQYHHQKWTMEYGFPAERVWDIDQDSLGYIWLATDMGILRFDGHRYDQFNMSNNPVFRSDIFNAVEVTPSGKIWFGNLSGLYYYQDGEFLYWTDSLGNSIENIERFEADSKGRLWIKQKNHLYVLDKDRISMFDTQGLWLSNIFKGRGNRMWFTSPNGILVEIQDTFIIKTDTINKLANEVITNLVEDSSGGVYLGIPFLGIYYYKDRKCEFLSDVFREKSPKKMIIDNYGYLWAGAKGIVKMNEHGYETFYEKDGLTDFGLTSLFNDRNGNIWVGTKKGLNLFYRNEVKAIHPIRNNRTLKYSVSTMSQVDSGEIFVGTYGEGIVLYRNGQLVLPANRFLAGEVIYAMRPVGNKISVSSNDGAFSIYQENDSLKIDKQVSGEVTLNHFYTSDSTLFLNGRNNSSRRSIFVHKNEQTVELISQRTNEIYWFHEDHDGNIMMGTKEGLFLWKGEELISLSEELNIPSSSFISHVYDQNKKIHWLGTDGIGLLKYQDGDIHQYNTRAGFPINKIYNIHLDDRGGTWIIGQKHAYYFKSDELLNFTNQSSSQFLYKVFNLNHTVSPNGSPASYQLENGNILIATRRRMLALNTENIQYKSIPLHIKTVIVDGDTIDHNSYFEIPAFSRKLTVGYTGIDFGAGQDLFFEYRLSGYEKQWNETAYSRTATYTHLPAGDYQFELRLKNSDGTFQYFEDKVVFSKAQKWYYLWYAILIYVVLFILLVRAIIIFRTRQIKQKNIALQKKVDTRTQELRELNTTLEQKVVERTHEIAEVNKALSESEERYGYAIDASNEGIWDYDVKSDSIKFSPAIYTMLGFEPYAFEESREAIYKLIHPEDQQKWHRSYHEQFIEDGDETQLQDEYRMYSKNNALVWILVKGKVVEWSEGNKPARIVGTHADISKEKRKNQEVLEAILKTEDTERKRISKDIHDGLQQTLTISSMNFQSVKKELAKFDAKTVEKFERGWEYLQNSIAESRAVAHSLMPKAIVDFGIISALESLMDQLNKASETTEYIFHHNFKHEKLDNQQIEITLYRILQESTNNIIKYAKASRVEVQLREYKDMYMLTIEDNGVGFDVNEVKTKGAGLGFKSMQNRLEAINGFLDINSYPGKGTSILIEINKTI